MLRNNKLNFYKLLVKSARHSPPFMHGFVLQIFVFSQNSPDDSSGHKQTAEPSLFMHRPDRKINCKI